MDIIVYIQIVTFRKIDFYCQQTSCRTRRHHACIHGFKFFSDCYNQQACPALVYAVAVVNVAVDAEHDSKTLEICTITVVIRELDKVFSKVPEASEKMTVATIFSQDSVTVSVEDIDALVVIANISILFYWPQFIQYVFFLPILFCAFDFGTLDTFYQLYDKV